MDSDLYNVLALVIMLATLGAVIAGVWMLSEIKKELATRDVGGAEPRSAVQVTSTYEPPTTAAAEVPTGFVSMAEVEPQASLASAAAMGGGLGSLRGDEPEEQPFEREGRWWFKRGDELLVYEEGTGQWVAGSQSSSTAAATMPGVSPAAISQADTHVDAGEGWKCASCGAINGSTATSCRMCFTPR